MSVVPKNIVERIQFAEDHLALWAANAVAMGSSAAEITAITAKTGASRDAYTAQQEAKMATKNATINLHAAMTTLSDAMSDLIKKVRAKAATDGVGVYALAGIPAPATPAPVGPPGKPFDFKVSLLEDGSLKLAWKCVNPANAAGTVYQVERSVDGGEFVSVGVCGERTFEDATLPAGAAAVTYEIRAVRSTAKGEVAKFAVQFGVSASGAATATVSKRLAA